MRHSFNVVIESDKPRNKTQEEFQALMEQKFQIAELEEGFDPKVQISSLWHICDVQSVRKHLTDEEALDVLQTVFFNMDCNEGINWTVIESAADDMYPAGGGND